VADEDRKIRIPKDRVDRGRVELHADIE
jgi:hypothetical protein